MAVNIAEYILFFFIYAVTFWIIKDFEADFQLKTQVLADNTTEIIGVNPAGKEVFKFYLSHTLG